MNTQQTNKRTLQVKGTNFTLQTLNPGAFFDATLFGDSLSGQGHTQAKGIQSVFTGDSLTATGVNDTLIGGAGNNSLKATGQGDVLYDAISQAGKSADTLTSRLGGTAVFSLGSAKQLVADSISGGSGIDTLAIAKNGTLADSLFANVSGVEVLSLTAPQGSGSNNVTFDTAAFAAGFRTVDGGNSGSSTFTQTSVDTLPMSLQGGRGSMVKDLFSIGTPAQFIADSITGGNSAGNTVYIQADATLSDSAFANDRLIQTLSLTGADNVTLDANAAVAGIQFVRGGDSGNLLVQTGNDSLSVTLVGGKGNDTFVIDSPAQFGPNTLADGSTVPGDSVIGTSGTDELAFTQAGSIPDSLFGRTSGVKILSLTSPSSVTLGSAASKAGLSTVIGGEGNDTFVQTAGNSSKLSIVGGVYPDLVEIANVKLLAGDIIEGSSLGDTLRLDAPSVLSDTIFAHDTGIQVLSLSGASAVTLGASAMGAGIGTVLGGGGTTGSKFTQTADDTLPVVLTGGSTLDVFTIDPSVFAADTISGADSLGKDTLVLSAATTLPDASLSNVLNIAVLSLTGASGVTLDAAAQTAGISAVLGGNSDGTIFQGTGDTLPLSLVGGKGNDLIVLADAAYVASDTFRGGAGINTLQVLGDATLSDSLLAPDTQLQALVLGGASAVTLDASAKKLGITSIYGGSGNTTLTQTSADSAALDVIGGSGNSTIAIGTVAELGKDTLSLTGGANEVIVSQGDTITDKTFTHVTGVQTLSLTGDSSAVLGTLAAVSGLGVVLGGAGKDTLSQTAAFGNALTIDGGAGTDLIQIDSRDYLVADSIIGGSGGIATLVITSASSLNDASFAQVQNTAILSLSGASAVTLDAQATTAQIATVYGGTGAGTFVQVSGVQTLLGGKSGDLFAIQDASLLAGDSIVGGGGKDTLQILGAGTLDDSLFAKVAGVQTLTLTGASALTLDSAAFAAGIAKVYADASGSTLAQGANDTAKTTLAVGGGNNLFQIHDATLLGNDSIAGSGNDTLTLETGDTVTDKTLGKVRGVAALELTGSSSVLLGTNAVKDGLASLSVGTGSATLNVSAAFTKNLYVDASQATGNNIFGLASASQLSLETIQGGTGTDTLFLANPGMVRDTLFTNLSNIKELTLSGASSVTLDAAAMAAGILTVQGGSGNTAITQGAGETTGLNLLGGAKGVNSFIVGSASQIAADTITGGSASSLSANALVLANAISLQDADLTYVTQIQALRLSLAGSSVALDSQALNAGIVSVVAAAGGSTIDQMAGETGALKLYGGNGNNLFAIDNSGLLVNDTIVGVGPGNTLAAGVGPGNTLAVGGDAVLDASAFKHVTKVGFLSLSGAGAVTLDSSAKNAGISTIVGGSGNSTYSQSAGSISLAAGSGNDLFSVTTALLLGGDTINGGDGLNTLVVSKAGKIDDGAFAHTSGFQILTLTGASAVTLGASAMAAGLATIVGGMDSLKGDTITQGVDDTAGLYLDASTAGGARNLLRFDYASLAAADTIVGSGQADTIAITKTDSVSAADFGNTSRISVLSLTGASAATLDGLSSSGFATLVGGASSLSSGETFLAGSADTLYVKAGSGNDLFRLATPDLLLGGYSLDGGAGTNTLELDAAATLNDASFANLMGGITVLNLSSLGGNALTLDANAYQGKIRAVYGTTGGLTLDQGANDTLAVSIYGGNSSLDQFTIHDAGELSKDFITDTNNGGVATLAIASATDAGGTVRSIVDQNFARISGIDLLVLGDSLNAAIGAKAGAAGLSTVRAYQDNTTLNASAFTGGASSLGLTIDLTGNQNGGDFIAAPVTGPANVLVSSPDQVGKSTFVGGGAHAQDTLSFTMAETLADSIYGSFSGFDAIALKGSASLGGNVLTLGANAGTAGIASVFGGAGGNTIDQLAEDGRAHYLDGSASANSSISNLFILDYASMLGGVSSLKSSRTIDGHAYNKGDTIAPGDTIVGSGLNDTLVIAKDDTLIGDTAFSAVHGVTNLTLTGSSSATLGGFAEAAGIMKVHGGTLDMTLTQTSSDTLDIVIDGTGANSNLFSIATSVLTTDASIIGAGAGHDTLAITGGNVSVGGFGNVTHMSALVLDGLSSNFASLDSGAVSAGFSLVAGTGADMTLVQTAAFNTAGVTLDGSQSNRNLFEIDASVLPTDASIVGGGLGSDTLAVTGDAVAVSDLPNVHTFSALTLEGASNAVTLDTGAFQSGITFVGASGTASLTQTANDTLSLVLDASNATNVLFTIDTNALAADQQGGGSLIAPTVTGSLVVTGDAVSVADLVNVFHVSRVTLDGKSSNAATLDAGAVSDSLAYVGVTGGQVTLTQTANAALALTLDGSQGTKDLFSIDTDVLKLDASLGAVIGGSGSNTLAVTGADAVYWDLANISSIGVLTLEGGVSNSATLDANALATGITLVGVAGGAASLTQSAGDTLALVLDGHLDSSNLFSVDTAVLTGDASIIGAGTAADTLAVTGDAVSYADLANVHAVGVLTLEGTASNAVTLDANALAAGITFVGVTGGTATLAQGAGETAALVLQGGSGSNLFSIDTSVLPNDTSVLGGSGTNTLAVTGDTVSYNDLGNVFAMPVLSLEGATSNAAILDANALASGITLVGVSGGDFQITQGSGETASLAIDGSKAATDLFAINTAVLVNDTVTGVAGSSTLAVTGDAVTYADLANVHAVGILSLEGTTSSAATLDADALATGITLVGVSGGAASLTQLFNDTLPMVLDGTKASTNLFSINTAVLPTDASILGGSGTNTLAVTGEDASYADLANIHAIGVLSLEGSKSNAATLDANALAAGITLVGVSGGAASLTQGKGETDAITLDGSNATSNLFLIATEVLPSDAAVIGSGTGHDTLAVTGEVVGYADLANVAGVNVLTLEGSVSNAATLGANAGTTGIQLVGIAGGSASLTQTSLSSGITLDGSKSGTNLFQIDTTVLADDTLIGNGTASTLAVTGGDTVAYAGLANVLGINALTLTGSVSSAATLDGNAMATGITLVGVTGGAFSVTQTAEDTLALVLDGSKAASNSFSIETSALVTDASVIGAGNGNDTLAVTGDTVSYNDLANVHAVETISLEGATSSAVNLDANALSSGITYVGFSGGSVSLTQGAGDSLALTLDGSGSASNLFTINTDVLPTDASVIGSGQGTDTLAVSGDAVQYADLGNVSGFNALLLEGASMNAATLDGNAAKAGILSVKITGGDASLTQGAGDSLALTLDGSASSSNLFSIDTGVLASDAAVIGAGNGKDTLAVTGESVTYADLANVFNVGVLSLEGSTSSAATLDANALAAGITLAGVSGGMASLTQTANDALGVTLDGSRAAGNLFTVDTNVLAIDGEKVIGAGNGKDTLAITGDQVNYDDRNNVLSVGVLSLEGNSSSSAILDANALATGITLVGVAGGAASLTQSAGDTLALTLDGSASSSNLFSIDTAVLTGDASIIGTGKAADTLAVTGDAASFADPGNIRGIGVLELLGATSSAATLNGNAMAASISTVIVNSPVAKLFQGLEDTMGLQLDGAGSGTNFFEFSEGSLVQNDTLVGNAMMAANTLAISAAGTIGDDAFGNVSGFGWLSLASGSAATLGGQANNVGIASIAGSEGVQSLTQTGDYTGAILASLGGTGAFLNVATAVQLEGDTVNGGSGDDTLLIASGGDVPDASFANLTLGTNALLTLGGSANVTLDSAAQTAGFSTVAAGKGATNITQNAGETNLLWLDGSDASNVLFAINDGALIGGDTFNGASAGASLTTLQVTGANVTFGDDAFAHASNIGILTLGDSNGVTLGSQAVVTGISSVYGGTGAVSIGQTDDTLYVNVNQATHANIYVGNSTLLANDTIAGSTSSGYGTTLTIGQDTNIGDASFANVTGINAIALTGTSAVTLGSSLYNGGIPDQYSNSLLSAVYGGAGSSTIYQTQDFVNAVTLDGSAVGGGNNLFLVDLAGEISNDTILGGTGTNTLGLVQADTLTDEALAHLHSVQVLSITGGLTSLGGNADNAGITTIAGAGVDNIIANTSLGRFYSLSLNAGQQTLSAGSGVDTLAVGSGDVITSTSFANISGVENLSLPGSVTADLGAGMLAAGVSLVSASGSGNALTLSVPVEIIDTASADTLSLSSNDTLISSGNSVSVTAADHDVLSLEGGNADLASLGANGSVYSSGTDATLVGANADTLSATGDNAFLTAGDYAVVTLSGNGAFASLGEVASVSASGTGATITGGNSGAFVIAGDGSEVTAGNNALLTLSGNGGMIGLGMAATATINGSSDSLTLGAGASVDGAGTGNSYTVGTGASLNLTGAGNTITGDYLLATLGDGNVISGGWYGLSQYATVQAGNGNTINAVWSTLSVGDANLLNIDGGFVTLGNNDTVDASRAGTGQAVTLGSNDLIRSIRGLNVTNLNGTNNNIVQRDGTATVADIGGSYNTYDLADHANVSEGGSNNIFTVGTDATIQAGGSDNIFSLGARASVNGSGNHNVYKVNAADLSSETIAGGSNDTLIVDGGSVSDSDLANISGITVLSLTGSYTSMTLDGYADGTGISTVIGGSGASTLVNASNATNGYLLDGTNASNNTFVVASAAQLLADTLVGSGTDTLRIGLDDITDMALRNISGIPVLALTGSSDITLGGYADGTGVSTIIGGRGSNTITQQSYATDGYLFDGSNGARNLYVINSASQVLNDTIVGSGTDTLQIGLDDVTDAALANVSGVPVIQLTGPSDITLGGYADGTGIVSLISGSGSDTFTQLSYATNGYVLDGSNGGNNLFSIASASQVSADTILGGAGVDTLQIGLDDVTDATFAQVSGVPVLQLTGSSDVTLGHRADLAGISDVVGGSGSSTFTQGVDNYSGLVLDGSGGTGNLYVIPGTAWLQGDTILGGNGVDTLQIDSTETVPDSAFAHVASVSVLALTGASDVTLGHRADLANITGVMGGTGSNTITQGADYYSAAVLDGSYGTGNLFVVPGTVWLNGDTILGGSGADTLAISSAESIPDAAFGNVSSVSVLSLTGASDVTLGHRADLANITGVMGGTGSNTITQGADYYSAAVLDGSYGTGNLFVVPGTVWLNGDTILGGAGASTLQISTEDRVPDTAFAHASGVAVLALTGSSDVTLGAAAQAAGITSVVGGVGASSIDASATTGNILLDGSNGIGANLITAGSGNDTLVAGFGADTLNGGAGADHFVLGNGAGGVALVNNFTANDTLDLAQSANGTVDYSIIGATPDDGSYNQQLFHGSTLIANLNVATGVDATQILANQTHLI